MKDKQMKEDKKKKSQQRLMRRDEVVPRQAGRQADR
jgi:hypothetical protein